MDICLNNDISTLCGKKYGVSGAGAHTYGTHVLGFTKVMVPTMYVHVCCHLQSINIRSQCNT